MHTSLEKFNFVKKQVNEIITQKQLKTNPKIIAVTKTHSLNKILPLIDSGHIHFGENKIQEAENKWIEIKKSYLNLQLHMIGSLQSNKVKKAVKIFDYIHSLDNNKLALKIFECEKEFKKKIKLFIQVNLSEDNNKSGVLLKDVNNFYNYCTKELSLNIIGLMCLPPIKSKPQEYFKRLKALSENLILKELSMGMSSDFEQAVINGSTFLRLGTVIFGQRTSTI